MMRKHLMRTCAGLATMTMLAGASPAMAAVSSTGDQYQQGGSFAVSIPVETIVAPGTSGLGRNGIVEIQVGRSRPLRVMVDTGTVGLRVFSSAWTATPGRVSVSKARLSQDVRGSALRGRIASAAMTIGGVTTERPVQFQIVDSGAATAPLRAAGVVGILGIGLSREKLPNPLLALPGAAGERWSLHFGRAQGSGRNATGSLVLNAPAPASTKATFSLPAQGPDAHQSLLWNDHRATGCWDIGRARTECVPTWFDSGFHIMRVMGREFSRVRTNAASSMPPRSKVSLSGEGISFPVWSFDTGSSLRGTQVKVYPKGSGRVNTGNAPFFDFTVSYDSAQGLISLSTP